MGSIMKKELVAVKDIHGFWTNILCASCTVGKNLSSFDDIVANIKECQPQLFLSEFVQESEEIYVLVDNMTQVNPCEKCK